MDDAAYLKYRLFLWSLFILLDIISSFEISKGSIQNLNSPPPQKKKTK